MVSEVQKQVLTVSAFWRLSLIAIRRIDLGCRVGSERALSVLCPIASRRIACSVNTKLLMASGKGMARVYQQSSSPFVICRLHHQNVPVERRDNKYGASRR